MTLPDRIIAYESRAGSMHHGWETSMCHWMANSDMDEYVRLDIAEEMATILKQITQVRSAGNIENVERILEKFDKIIGEKCLLGKKT